MKIKLTLKLFCFCILHSAFCLGLRAQGTSFTYQGRLNDDASPANGNYDLRFTIYDSTNNPGVVIAGPITNAPTGVSNGLFAATLDFGAGVFTGPDRWLEIGVRSNSLAAFTTLSSRQKLTPTPYAILAGNVSSNAITSAQLAPGSVTSSQLAAGAVNSAALADVISLGETNAFGRLDVYRTSANTPAISLIGSVSQISTYGADGLEQIRLWGTGWGELFLNNSLSNNANAVTLTANANLGGLLRLSNSNGLSRAVLNGANGGALLQLFDGTSAESVRLNTTGPSWLTGGNVGIGTADPTDAILDVEGAIHINDHDIYIRPDFDRNHGLGYRSIIASNGVDGPFLYGFNGGALGVSAPDSTALTWNYLGDVGVTSNLFAVHITADRNNINTGSLFPGIVFGPGSGEGIASKRNAGGNQFGLDFYTASANRMTIHNNGNVGIGTTAPGSKLQVAGDTRIEGITQIGSGTGTAQAPDKGLIVRRVQSTTSSLGSVVARTDKLTLERDGSFGGWQIVNVASPGPTTIAATGLTSAGATVNFVTSFGGSAGAGTTTVFTDAQNVVSFRCSFGDSFGPGHLTEVSLTRFPGDFFWTGTLTSTFNQ